MNSKALLKYALTIVLMDAAQLAYAVVREKVCDHYGIKVDKTSPKFSDPNEESMQEAVWKDTTKDVN